jgi:hypothetical protein
VRELICGLLHPDPERRMGVHEALQHEWVAAAAVEEQQQQQQREGAGGEHGGDAAPRSLRARSVASRRLFAAARPAAVFDSPPLRPAGAGPQPTPSSSSSLSFGLRPAARQPSAPQPQHLRLPAAVPAAGGLAGGGGCGGSARGAPPQWRGSPRPRARSSEGGECRCDATDRAPAPAAPGGGDARRAGGDAVAVACPPSPPLPVFAPSVHKSTRFVTALPAPDILQRIGALLEANPHPLPPPFAKLRQTVEAELGAHRLLVRWGGIRVATVQVFLLRGGSGSAGAPLLGGSQQLHLQEVEGPRYLVEVTRGRTDTFTFRRWYERLLEELAAQVRREAGLGLLLG